MTIAIWLSLYYMKNYGLVSIITPNWNCGKFVSETIRSVLVQTYQNWEMIIVDDSSTDGSCEVMKPLMEADSRIRLLKNPKNSGAAVSRNYALREAKGRWIAFLDSDDLWAPEKLEKQLEFMCKNGYDFSYTDYVEIDDEGNETGMYISGPKRVSKFGMFAFCWLGCLTVMYNRDKVGLIQIEDIKKNNDYAMWLKVCRKANCYMLREPLAKYRRGRTGSISTHGYKTMIKWHYKLWHNAEGMNHIASLFWTCMNLMCGVLKKLHYVKKNKVVHNG